MRGAALLSLLVLSAVEGPVPAARAAPGGATADKTSPEARRKVLELSRTLLVETGLMFKAYDRNAGIDEDEFYNFHSEWSDSKDQARNRKRQRIFGVKVSTDGTFVASTLAYDWRHVESVIAVTPEGTEVPARPIGISRSGRLMWFKADGLAFPDIPVPRGGPLRPGAEILLAHADFDDGRKRVGVTPVTLEEVLWLDRGTPREVASSLHGELSESLEAVFSKEGDWLGVDPRQSRLAPDGSWKVAPWQLEGDRLPWEQWLAAAKKAAAALESRLPVVHLRFRLDKGAPGPGETSLLDKSDQQRAVKERSDVGLPVRRGLVFVPSDIERGLVRRLESVTVTVKGKTLPARFIGVTRELEGYLLEADVAAPAAAPDPPADGGLFIAHSLRYFGGRIDLRMHPETFEGTDRGYKDVLTRRVSIELHPHNAVFSDLAGETFGYELRSRRYESEPEKESWREPRAIARFFSAAELDKAFSPPEKAVDALLQPNPADVVRGKPWLGVETQGITPDLAKELKIERETLDGTRGQLVTFVYPGSPAEKLKLLPGDLLLTLRDRAKKDELPIAADGESPEDGQDGRWWRTWFIRKTPVTEALAHFDVGTRVQLSYAHAHAVKTADLTLEQGPPDFESAPKYKAPRTGLTAKDITYDVRNILRLADVKGVLVYDVDSGSPANVAEIDPMDMVVAVGSRPVAGLKDFQAIVRQEQARGAESVRLSLRYLNDTRFADLKFSPRSEKEGPAESVTETDDYGDDGGDGDGGEELP